MAARAWLLRGTALGCATVLTACGGSGGGGINSTPAPIEVAPTPTPTPVPTPTPTPAPTPVTTGTAVNGDTVEYRATVGAVNMNALAAYNAGATGAGVGIAIVDSGIDLQSAEFDNRISGASQAFAGNASVDDEGGHGTAVAFTAAGRRNGAGTHGVAFGATVIALRADRPGSCTNADPNDSERGCKFPTDAIRDGVDAARVAGARVINLSLGGSAMPQNLQAAVGRATAAGIVVVIAAGNDGQDNPDAFTDVAQSANARGAVIIAGSIGSRDTLSTFSDKAGGSALSYLAAIGERVRAPDETGLPNFWSGTSFAAPQISAAVALLAQAFPNLTGAQIVSLLFSTARDAGAAGMDPIYGRGILDLTRAFQPVGSAAVAGSTAAVSLTLNGRTSAAMGDVGGDTGALGAGTVILDSYGRAFAIDLAQTIARAAPTRPLDAALRAPGRVTGFAAGGTAVSMTLTPTRTGAMLDRTSLSRADADGARAIAASVVQRLGADTGVAFAIRAGASGLQAGLAGRQEPAFLVAGTGGTDTVADSAVALRHRLGPWGLTVAAETGAVLSAREPLLPGTRGWQRTPYDRAALTLDRQIGPVFASLGGQRLAEHDTLLGARFDAALGSPGATTWFLDAAARLDRRGWTLGGTLRQGWTDARVRGLTGSGRLRSAAWSLDLGRGGWGFRAAQPLRVTGGGLDLTLPTLWDYDTNRVAVWTPQHLSLTPQGHELDLEMRYAVALAGGTMATNLYWRRDPGNIAALPTDRGAALRWSRGF